MAVVLADIKAAFPEFDLKDDTGATIAAQDALITAKIASAEAQTDRTIFPSTANADESVKYLTAHLLAISPSGINARLAKNGAESIYLDTYKRIAYSATALASRVP